VALVAGDQEIGSGCIGAFEKPVVVIVGAGSENPHRVHGVGSIPEPAQDRPNADSAESEFRTAQHPFVLRENELRNVELHAPMHRKFQDTIF
jgi:hypothetical protein